MLFILLPTQLQWTIVGVFFGSFNYLTGKHRELSLEKAILGVSIRRIKNEEVLLSSKPFFLKLIRYMIDQHPPPIVVLITDTLNRHNHAVFSEKQRRVTAQMKEKYVRMAKKEGEVYFRFFTELIQKDLKPEHRSTVKIETWNRVYEPQTKQHLAELYSSAEFENFRKDIFVVVEKNYQARKTPNSHPNKLEIAHLTNYILEELPILVRGMPYEDQIHRAVYHVLPTTASPSQRLESKPNPSEENPLQNLVLNVHSNPETPYRRVRAALGISNVDDLSILIDIPVIRTNEQEQNHD